MGNSAWCNVHLPNCSYLAHLHGAHESCMISMELRNFWHAQLLIAGFMVLRVCKESLCLSFTEVESWLWDLWQAGNETKPFCQVSAKLCWITHGLQCLGGQTCLQFKRLLKCRWKLFGNYAEGEAWIMLMSVWSIEWYLPWPICIEYCLNDKRQHVFNFHRVHIILL